MAPEPSANEASAKGIYARDMTALMAEDALRRFDLSNGIGPKRRPEDLPSGPVRRERQELQRLAAPLTEGRRALAEAGERNDDSRYESRWRTSGQTLYLAPPGPETGTAPYTFSALQASRIDVELRTLGNQRARLDLACDGAVEVEGPKGTSRRGAGDRFTIALTAGERKRKPVVLHPALDVTRCEGVAVFASGTRTVSLMREESAYPEIAALDARFDVCGVPAGKGATPIERVFHSDRWLSQTCAFPPGRVELLADERDAFNAKVEALLGRRLSDRFLDAGDPEARFDFSRAPRLKLIIVSYLDIKADYSGRIIDRLLRYHAQRGTVVRIVSSGVLLRDKDLAMLERLAADHPNVTVKAFRWIPPKAATPGERLARMHRVHHTKLLAALSTEPGRSAAIVGGRNIHDGFLFDEPVDLSAHPELQQYGRNRGLTLNYYSNWRDLDVALHGDAAVAALAAQFSTLWFDDARTHVARPFAIAAPGGAMKRAGIARHFISVPYADGHALEAYYIDLIDAASTSIDIVNPYLNLTPGIGAAMERAITRGVTISIVGRIDMRGDLGGDVVTALNQAFVERYAGRIALYDYKASKILLHAKILLIDGELASVSSVNFNNRSFIHDNENGVTFLDPSVHRKLKAVFDAYRDAASPVEVRDVPLAWKFLFTSKLIREAL